MSWQKDYRQTTVLLYLSYALEHLHADNDLFIEILE